MNEELKKVYPPYVRRGGKSKKSLKPGQTVEDLLVGWSQCQHYMKSKFRLCNITKANNSNYCGVHQIENNDASKERVPCPLDPNHSVYKHSLSKHLKICNVETDLQNMKKLPFFCEECNSGSTSLAPKKEEREEKVVDPISLMNKVMACYERNLSSQAMLPNADDDIDDTKGLYPSLEQENNLHDENNIYYKSIESKVVATLAFGQTSFAKTRHARQDARIIHQMINYGLIGEQSDRSNRSTAYVELGCGKGLLGLAVNCIAPPSASLVLVEKAGVKKKADKILKEKGETKFYRARMDIRHCFIPNLPGIALVEKNEEEGGEIKNQNEKNKKNVVIIAKHLCGCASDLAIRSLNAYQRKDNSLQSLSLSSSSPPSPSLEEDVRGIAIATCCHHACNWNDYVGKEWLQNEGFTANEFEILRHWSAWAHILRTTHHQVKSESYVGNDAKMMTDQIEEEKEGEEEEQDEHNIENEVHLSIIRPPNITRKEMSAIGRRVKRIIDQGRIEYIRSQFGMTASQLQYCHPALSPECVMIVATAKRKVGEHKN